MQKNKSVPERVEEVLNDPWLQPIYDSSISKEHKREALETLITRLLTETDQQAREYCNAWIDPQKEMPEHNIQVLCAVQHFTTKRIVYDVLETKECDDAVWFDGDGEIDCWNWNVIGWKHIPTLSNPPSQV